MLSPWKASCPPEPITITTMQAASVCVLSPSEPCSASRDLDCLSSKCAELHSLGRCSADVVRNYAKLTSWRRPLPRLSAYGRDGVKSQKAMAVLGVEKSGAVTEADIRTFSRLLTSPTGCPVMVSEQKVYDVVLKQAAMVNTRTKNTSTMEVRRELVPANSTELLSEAYLRCGEVCAEYAKTFYLGTMLMTPERQRAIWAIYVWCRRTDELVDGPNASHITPTALDRWEQRLEDLFDGKPYDMLDAALSDTVAKFPVDIQPFRDMIEGMRMDLVKPRYESFDELYLYCYYVAGTVGLMSVPVMGIAPESKATTESVYNAALSLGIANQLTNILRDVGEDARRGRIYLPRNELAKFGLSEDDIFAGKVTDRWRAFMKSQIRRARKFFDEAENGVVELDKDSRWPVWASLVLYRQILDSIEANNYDNFTKRAYVGKWKKLLSLPAAYVRALVPPPPIPRVVNRTLSL